MTWVFGVVSRQQMVKQLSSKQEILKLVGVVGWFLGYFDLLSATILRENIILVE